MNIHKTIINYTELLLARMAKRARMTVDEVMERWDDASSEIGDELDVFDDPHEPTMEGSDNEFCNIEDVGGYDSNDELHDDASLSEDPTAPPDDDVLDSTIDPDSDMDSAAADSEPQWTTTLKRNTVSSFSSYVGPAVSISKSPMEVFQLFFIPELLDMIVKETNNYAKLVMGDEKFSKWSKMDVAELKALLGFKILMAMNNLPSIDVYWKRDPFLRYFPIADRISRDRFRELSQYLHFTNNDTLVPQGSPGQDRLGKVRPLIDHLASRFAEMYQARRV